MIRVQLPYHLRTLAHVSGDVELAIDGTVSIGSVIDAIEGRYPMLTGTIREHKTGKRRAYVRFFACGEDISHEPMTTILPEAIVKGTERFIVLGAISGG